MLKCSVQCFVGIRVTLIIDDLRDATVVDLPFSLHFLVENVLRFQKSRCNV